MISGNVAIAGIDKKGRILIPKEVRDWVGLRDEVILETDSKGLRVRPLKPIDDPIKFLVSLKVGKPGKSLIESKREAEGFFMRGGK